MSVILFANLKGGVAKATNRLLACERRRATLKDLLLAMLDFAFEATDLNGFVVQGTSTIGGGLPNLGVIPCSLRIDDFHTNMAKGRRSATFSKDLNDPGVPDRRFVQASNHFMERIRRIGFKVVGLGTLWTLYRGNNEIHERAVQMSYRRHPELAGLPRPFRTVIPNATAIATACELTQSVPSLSVKYEPTFARLYQSLAGEIATRLLFPIASVATAVPQWSGLLARSFRELSSTQQSAG